MTSYITGDIFTFSPPKQTLRAWNPYSDCRSILFQFQNSDIDDEHPEWRIYWVAGIALLRTIGHVLIKADALTSPSHKSEIDRLWTSWKQDKIAHSIFWDFIEAERNNLLKTYTFGAILHEADDELYVRYTDGSDALQLFREAVYWWRYHLILLEQKLP